MFYLLENFESDTHAELYISAKRNTQIDVSGSQGETKIKIDSDDNSHTCFVELKIPGSSNIEKLKISYLGDRIPNLLLNDFKLNRTFTNPLKIENLIVEIHDSFPNIHFVNPHQINRLNVRGTY